MNDTGWTVSGLVKPDTAAGRAQARDGELFIGADGR